MQAMFDIAVGRCESIDNKVVTVQLDSAIVSRLVPAHPWRSSGTSRLKFDIGLCSLRMPPEAGHETFLQRELLLRNPSARLDLLGDGNFVPVRLGPIGADTDPQIVDAAAKPSWSDRPSTRRTKGS